MKKSLSILLILIAFIASAQDPIPLPSITVKKLISPNTPVFYYNTADSALWVFKGETGWLRIATNQQLIKYYVPYVGATKDVNLSTKTILAEGQQLPLSNGGCQISTLTDNGNGTVTLSSGDYHLSANASGKGSHNYTLTGGTFTMTDQSQNYIVADYNSGAPYIHVITDVTLINETTIVPIYSIYRNGTYLHTQNWDALGIALANKIHQSIVKTQRYRRESGLALSEYGTHNLNLSVGRIWTGAVPITLDAIATATDNLFLWYHSGGVWTQSVVSQYNNTQYDNGTNLVTLTNNRYSVSWVFRGVETGKHLYIVLGTGDYSENQAISATLPAIPVAISSHAVLVAKLIVKKNDATALSIQSAFDTQFGLSAIQSHGDLTGRDVVDSHPAGAITNTPYSSTSSINIQNAINELTDEKEPALTKGNLTENTTGLEFSSIRQVIGGSTTLTVSSGYVIPTTTNISHAESGYDNQITAIGVSGTTTKTITLTQQDAGTITANFNVTKSDVGLGNVDNTSDVNKPISTAVQTALNGKEPANANIQTHITNDADLSITNEGQLSTVGTSNNATIQSNTSGSSILNIKGAGINTVSASGNNITITGTEVDGSVTNEIQAPTRVGDVIGLTQTTTTISIADKEPVFSKNTAFNKNFGTTAGTVLEGRTFGTAANNNTGDFILNQNSSAQAANGWINGTLYLGTSASPNTEYNQLYVKAAVGTDPTPTAAANFENHYAGTYAATAIQSAHYYEGNNNQDHGYATQNWTYSNGLGTISEMAGLITAHNNNSGNVSKYYGIKINSPTVSGGSIGSIWGLFSAGGVQSYISSLRISDVIPSQNDYSHIFKVSSEYSDGIYGITKSNAGIFSNNTAGVGIGGSIGLGGIFPLSNSEYTAAILKGSPATNDSYKGKFSIYTTSSGNYGEVNSANYERFNITEDGATFQRTVNSTGYLLNNNNLFSSLTANKITQWDGTKLTPIPDGTNGQVLQTNGSGVYSFVKPEITSLASTGAGANQVATANGSNAVTFQTLKTINSTSLLGSGNITAGNVFKVGTPVDTQLGIWTGDGTIKGVSNLSFTDNTTYHVLDLKSPAPIIKLTDTDYSPNKYGTLEFDGSSNTLGLYNYDGLTNNIFAKFTPTGINLYNLVNTTSTDILYYNNTTKSVSFGAAPATSGMVWPAGSGIPIVSSGSSWGTTIALTGNSGQFLNGAGNFATPTFTSQWTTDGSGFGISYANNIAVGTTSISNAGVYVNKNLGSGYGGYFANTGTGTGLVAQSGSTNATSVFYTVNGNSIITFDARGNGAITMPLLASDNTPADVVYWGAGGVLTHGAKPSGGGGGVSSVSASTILTGTGGSFATVSVSNPTTTPAIAYSLSSQTANLVLASPSGSSGVPSYRKIVVGDISATGTPSASTYLRGDGTWNTPSGTNLWQSTSGGISPLTITDEVRIGSTSDNGDYKLQVAGQSYMNYSGASSGLGLYVASNGLYSAQFDNSVGTGILVNSTNSMSGVFASRYSSTNTSEQVARFVRTTSGTAANSIGSHISFYTNNSTGNTNISEYGRFGVISTDITTSSEDGKFEWSLATAGTVASKMVLTNDGNLTAYNFTSSSDRRLKKNIKLIDFSKGIDDIKFIQFTMKNDSTDRLRFGVIAQDVEKILPSVVYTDDKGMKSVAYTDLLVAKMARMEEIIKSLENRIKTLENEK